MMITIFMMMMMVTKINNNLGLKEPVRTNLEAAHSLLLPTFGIFRVFSAASNVQMGSVLMICTVTPTTHELNHDIWRTV